MRETAWAHLPNAAVIDALLEEAAAQPEVWQDGWFVAQNEVKESTHEVARIASRIVAQEVLRDDAYAAVWGFAWDIYLPAARYAWRGATYALIAWDSSADLLRLTPDALRTIIDTCDGDVKHQAVLLLPAVIARSTV